MCYHHHFAVINATNILRLHAKYRKNIVVLPPPPTEDNYYFFLLLLKNAPSYYMCVLKMNGQFKDWTHCQDFPVYQCLMMCVRYFVWQAHLLSDLLLELQWVAFVTYQYVCVRILAVVSWPIDWKNKWLHKYLFVMLWTSIKRMVFCQELSLQNLYRVSPIHQRLDAPDMSFTRHICIFSFQLQEQKINFLQDDFYESCILF